jgi:uncharacterized RDD family membrane protein YckC
MPRMEERYQVPTPENVTFDYDVAGIGSRFMAALADGLLYGLMVFALTIAYGQLEPRITDSAAASAAAAAYIGLSFALYWAYYILFELVWGGQSPGKRLVRLRVVRHDGTPASPGQIVIRNVVRLVDLFPGFYATGLVVMFLNSQSRRLGDLAAGTLVVREGRSVTLEHVDGHLARSPAALPEQAASEAAMLPVHRLDRARRDLARQFLARRAAMAEGLRATIAVQIAAAVAEPMGLPAPADPPQAERLLELAVGALDMQNAPVSGGV